MKADYRFGFAAALAVVVAVMFGGVVRAQTAPQPLHVLFIGNSYTAYNDLPIMVAEMGRTLGYDIRSESRTIGGGSFADHLRNEATLRAINSRRWDVVVLQNYSLQPSLPPDDVRTGSLLDARSLARRIRRNHRGTRIVYYVTWGRRDGDLGHCLRYPLVCTFDGHTEALRQGYGMYQRATGGAMAPVGLNWRRVVHDRSGRRSFRPRALWVEDGSHPSLLGSYLAAATLLRTITGAPVSQSGYTAGLSARSARYLRLIADTR